VKQVVEMPELSPMFCVQAEYSFIAGAKKDFSASHHRTRFDMAVSFGNASLFPARRIDAVKLANAVLMHSLAHVESATGQARR